MRDNIREMPVGSDPQLSAMEKETTLTIPNDTDRARIHSEVPTVIKWVLSVSESEIEQYGTHDGEIVAVTATIPKGILKLQASARKSNTHSQMVSYGDN
ncbi:hypothetical protein OSG_eHP20_00115 [environmental Halophage eHP-20]|nr:hypothetical protein OSG_eHP20_00115 [environmental Halophage eHP-20]